VDLIEAVKKLRAHLGETQQQFAARLGLSMSAIQNYERDRSPTGRALAMLAKAATDASRRDLADLFAAALGRELGLGQQSGAIFSSEWDDGGTKLSSFLIVDTDQNELVDFLLAAWETVGRYLGAKDPKMKATAKKVIDDFTRSASHAWRAK
jgi:transcriptional regulator with XRE-family HTH domain